MKSCASIHHRPIGGESPLDTDIAGQSIPAGTYVFFAGCSQSRRRGIHRRRPPRRRAKQCAHPYLFWPRRKFLHWRPAHSVRGEDRLRNLDRASPLPGFGDRSIIWRPPDVMAIIFLRQSLTAGRHAISPLSKKVCTMRDWIGNNR